jgi:hypothetical protein
VIPEYMAEPEFIYRFMEKEEYYNAFLDGRIWISTLSHCRRVEEDPGEGTDTYHSGIIGGHGDDPGFRRAAARASIGVGPEVRNGNIRNNIVVTEDADAWVLCTTFNPDGYSKRKFGPFGVRIAQPVAFFRAVSLHMQDRYNAGRCTIAPVKYGTRDRFGNQGPPEARSFLKPEAPFAQEKELRMLWEQYDDDRVLQGMLIDCPKDVMNLISPIPPILRNVSP